jgi:hypothetical protein
MSSKLLQNGPISDVSVSISTNGDNTIVAAVASKQYRLLSLALVAAGAVTVQIGSDTGGTFSARTGAMSLAANGTLVLPLNTDGWATTDAGKALNIKLGAAVAVAGVAKVQTIG